MKAQLRSSKLLGIGQKCVRIEWDSGVPDDFTRLIFAPWEIVEGEQDHTVSVSSRDGQYRIESPQGSFVAGDIGSALANLEYSLTCIAQEILSDHLQIHASCFGTDEGSVLTVGGHGAGKTTLALTAISSGCYALSDDVCVIGHDDQSVHGFPRPFKATDHTWSMTPRPAPEACPHYYAAPDITYVFFHEPRSRFYRSESELKYLLFPVRCPEETKIIHLGETESLGRLLRQGFNYTRLGEGETVRRLLNLIRKTTPCELRYHDHWDAVRAVKDLLAG